MTTITYWPLIGDDVGLKRVAAALAALFLLAVGAAPATAATATPTALTATAKNGRYVQLAWHRSIGDNGSYTYRVFRDGLAIGAKQSTVMYLDRPALGRHAYQVRAVDGVGIQSALTAPVTQWAVSKLLGAVAPSKPVALAGVTRSDGAAHLTWHAGTGGTSATSLYRIYRNGMAVGHTATTSFNDYRAGLKAASYDYSVQAVDANGYTSAMTATVHVALEPAGYPWAGTLYRYASSANPWVALTFDDCLNGPVVARLASILRSNSAAGTFFCTGTAASRNVDLMASIARDFPIGNHTYDHKDLNTLTNTGVFSELTTATNIIEDATGRPMPPIMRPPYGHANTGVRADCGQLGFAVVRWNIETNDWRSTQTSSGVLAAALEAKAGYIVIMHDRTKTAEVLAKIISGLRNKGLKLVTVPQLLGIPWQPAERDY